MKMLKTLCEKWNGRYDKWLDRHFLDGGAVGLREYMEAVAPWKILRLLRQETYVVMLNDGPVAVARTAEQAQKIVDAVKAQGGEHVRFVNVYEFDLDSWPEQWAGPEPR